MYYEDLATECDVAEGRTIRAVGWLSAEHDFPRGRPPHALVRKLNQLAARWTESCLALGWPFALGYHTCELCGAFDCAGNFGVPSDSVIFACPEMVAHYVSAHEYEPPDEFVQAVMASPLPGTPEYERAVHAWRASAGSL